MSSRLITPINNRLLLIPAGGSSVPFEFINQMNRLHEQSGGLLPVMAIASGSYPHRNKQFAVYAALQLSGWDYLLFLDTDMGFPDNLISRVKRYRDPVVGGLYFGRVFPDHGPVTRVLEDLDSGQWRTHTEEEVEPWLEYPGLYDVDGIGTGCLAIRRDVLENWPEEYPCFDTVMTADGNNMTTEDLYFCWRCKQQGIQPRLDSSVLCSHSSSVVMDVNTYLGTTEALRVNASA